MLLTHVRLNINTGVARDLEAVGREGGGGVSMISGLLYY